MSASNNHLGDQMDAVLQLMTKRATGEVSTDQVETAVSDILQAMGANPHPQERQQPRPYKENRSGSMETIIKVDTDFYDDDKDAHDDTKSKRQRPEALSVEKDVSRNDDDDDDEDPNYSEESFDDKTKENLYKDAIAQIPMGKEGAKMMTTFGDGPKPSHKALAVALLGTRKTLQIAIMDARAIRRRTKQTFDEARQTLQRLNQTSLADANSLDPTMMYRAQQSRDKLCYRLPCGFEKEQLDCLFPEEMQSYRRWNDMYDKSQKDAEENAVNNAKSEATEPAEQEEENSIGTNQLAESLGGHLIERAAHFDTRTEQMKSEWYLKFAQVRQGSFLPRRNRQRKSKEELKWEEHQKQKQGRRNDWESLSATSVRFLHWLGFEPSTIRPPNDETTKALAFLGHDFMGKIVEKAIFLCNLKCMEENKESAGTALWELQPGQQLSKEDIEAAIRDPEIQPKPLYTTLVGREASSSKPSCQRYFGPGFERRLELEMEELAAAGRKAKLTEEEQQFRQDEAALFAKMSAPPCAVESLTDLITKCENQDDEPIKEKPSKKHRSDIE